MIGIWYLSDILLLCISDCEMVGKKIMNAPSIRWYQPDLIWLHHLR